MCFEVKNFASKDLFASSLGTFVITIMGLKAKRRYLEFVDLKINVCKIMTSEGTMKIKSLLLEIFMPSNLDSQNMKFLRKKLKILL